MLSMQNCHMSHMLPSVYQFKWNFYILIIRLRLNCNRIYYKLLTVSLVLVTLFHCIVSLQRETVDKTIRQINNCSEHTPATIINSLNMWNEKLLERKRERERERRGILFYYCILKLLVCVFVFLQ